MINRAKRYLIDNNVKLVIINNTNIITSNKRGVKALLDLLDSKVDFSGCFVADRVVGKAAAMIYVLLGVKGLYASVISEGAKSILTNNGIFLEYDEAVPYIVNRAGDGMCPMEMAVGDEIEPKKAVQRVRTRLAELTNN